MGNDTVSSLQVSWASQCQAPGAPVMSVTFCGGGVCDSITADISDLGLTSVGNDRVAEPTVFIELPISVYSEPGFEGYCFTRTVAPKQGFWLDSTMLKSRASSIALNHTCSQAVALHRREAVGRLRVDS